MHFVVMDSVMVMKMSIHVQMIVQLVKHVMIVFMIGHLMEVNVVILHGKNME